MAGGVDDDRARVGQGIALRLVLEALWLERSHRAAVEEVLEQRLDLAGAEVALLGAQALQAELDLAVLGKQRAKSRDIPSLQRLAEQPRGPERRFLGRRLLGREGSDADQREGGRGEQSVQSVASEKEDNAARFEVSNVSGTVRALGLFSGGLDSLLAARVLARAGVAVRRVYLRTGFGRQARERSVDRIARAEPDGVEIHDVSERYLREVVLRPRYGRGAGMNRCMDCRVFMLGEADRLARAGGIELLFTGEVVGQRALDQSRAALEHAERRAGVSGRLLRPLCAALMAPTDLEKSGALDRSRALRLHGSSRRGQLSLARELGIDEFPTPSGGCCRLADRYFARRLRDHLSHHDAERIEPDQMALLQRGRHFRLDWRLKVVLGRDRTESVWLRSRAAGRPVCQVASGKGSLALVDGVLTEPRIPDVAALAARYSADRGRERVEVVLEREGKRSRLTVAPAPARTLERWRI